MGFLWVSFDFPYKFRVMSRSLETQRGSAMVHIVCTYCLCLLMFLLCVLISVSVYLDVCSVVVWPMCVYLFSNTFKLFFFFGGGGYSMFEHAKKALFSLLVIVIFAYVLVRKQTFSTE